MMSRLEHVFFVWPQSNCKLPMQDELCGLHPWVELASRVRDLGKKYGKLQAPRSSGLAWRWALIERVLPGQHEFEQRSRVAHVLFNEHDICKHIILQYVLSGLHLVRYIDDID